ncbi:hypothetical protein GCM10028775_13800 [Catellatospora paridis]
MVVRYWAGFASLGAGLIHLTVVSEHVAQWWLYGVFFILLGVAQMGWAVDALAGDLLPIPRPFAAVNAAVVGLWLLTRTTGLPIGPEPWRAETVGAADLLCSVLEVLVVALLVLAIHRPSVQEPRALSKEQIGLIAVGAVAIAAITVAALATSPPRVGGHAPHHGAASPTPDSSATTRPPAPGSRQHQPPV